MLINAQLLLQFQRCQRRPFLDIYGDYQQRDLTEAVKRARLMALLPFVNQEA